MSSCADFAWSASYGSHRTRARGSADRASRRAPRRRAPAHQRAAHLRGGRRDRPGAAQPDGDAAAEPGRRNRRLERARRRGEAEGRSPVPRAIFVDPPLATVGMTEEQAVAAGHSCWCRAVPLSSSATPQDRIVSRSGAESRGNVSWSSSASSRPFSGESVGRDGHERSRPLGELRQVFLQLTELLAAVRSPATTVEHHDERALFELPREVEAATGRRAQIAPGSRRAHGDRALESRWRRLAQCVERKLAQA